MDRPDLWALVNGIDSHAFESRHGKQEHSGETESPESSLLLARSRHKTSPPLRPSFYSADTDEYLEQFAASADTDLELEQLAARADTDLVLEKLSDANIDLELEELANTFIDLDV